MHNYQAIIKPVSPKLLVGAPLNMATINYQAKDDAEAEIIAEDYARLLCGELDAMHEL